MIGKDVFGSNEASVKQIETCLANFYICVCNKIYVLCKSRPSSGLVLNACAYRVV